MALTDIETKKAKAGQKQYKLTDGRGLYLLVTTTGCKFWRYDYRYDGKRKTLALGIYPETSLSEARDLLHDAHKNLKQGIDPGQKKKAKKLSEKAAAAPVNTFEVVARDWYKKFKTRWTKGHAETILSRLENYAFPFMGQKPIIEVNAPDVLRVLRHIEANGAIVTAHRIRTVISQVMRFAVANGLADRDPAADTKGAIPPAIEKHMAAIIDPIEFGGLLRAIGGYQASFVVKCALRLQAYTFVRPGELRHAEWQEIDLEAAQWNIPADRMKLRRPHIVPLSIQAKDILEELETFTGSGRFVFPGGRTKDRPLSENGVTAALISMGYKNKMTGHGFRAAARTMLDEVLQQRVDIIEHQLAHAVKDPNGRAYNRTSHLEARRVMMQLWADYLDGLKAGAKVLPLVKSK